MENKIKKRRLRKGPLKKWTHREVSLILNYIQTVGNYEKPTAQVYYRKLLEKTKIEATWDLVRWKMRNLKHSFGKATEWRESACAGLEQNDEGTGIIEAKFAKMCPYYEKLDEIFNRKNAEDENSFATYELTDLMQPEQEQYFKNFNCTASSPETVFKISEFELAPDETNENLDLETTPIGELPIKPTNLTVANAEILNELPIITSTSSLEEIKLQLEREKFAKGIEIENKKLDLEKEKIEKEYELQNRRLKLEEEKLRCNQEIKKQEFQLVKLQMEKEERIAKFEIEMKYKNYT